MTPLRVTRVTYGPTVEPLVDILVQLYEWAIARRRQHEDWSWLPPEERPE